jgi:hypothetical protein
MNFHIYLDSGITLQISSEINKSLTYPTARIQKGLVLLFNDQDLSEEAVGFGVPVIKRGLQTIFPGGVELFPHDQSPSSKITARYNMNLEERITKGGSGLVNNRLVYASKNVLAALIRNLPFMRGLLTHASNLFRASLGWETTYEPISFFTYLAFIYSIDAGREGIRIELIGENYIPQSISELIVMNEQGANHFDQYGDSNGTCLTGNKIGCWDQVTAAEASFISSRHQISFSLPQVNGAKLYRGRELIGTRLAWAGFGYSFPPNLENFNYTITLKGL